MVTASMWTLPCRHRIQQQHSHALHGNLRKTFANTDAFSCCAFRRQSFCKQYAARLGAHHVCCSAGEIGLVLETDTIAIDTHNDGHRVAFNQAFAKMGLSGASWPPSVYLDLRRSADGTALGMLRIYFETVGWPSTLSSSQHKAFAEQVVQHKDVAFRKLLEEGQVPLRPGVAQLVDDALADGAKVALLCGTNSTPEDNVGTAAVFGFGVQRARHMKLVYTWGSDSLGTLSDDSDEELDDLGQLSRLAAEAQAKVKQQEAIALTRNMKNVGVDANILASQRQMGSQVMSRAANELGVSAIRCALLAANELTLQAGRGAGMTAACVPTALAGRYKPPSSQANYDGFGAGGGATWPRIKGLVNKYSR